MVSTYPRTCKGLPYLTAGVWKVKKHHAARPNYPVPQGDFSVPLADMLKEVEVTNNTFGSSAKFKEARLAWEALKNARELNRQSRAVRKPKRKSKRDK